MAGLLVVALISVLIYKFYFGQIQPAGSSGTPAQTINVVGVKNDLIAIAQAERNYQVEHSAYAPSIDELVSSGAMTLAKPGRDGYTYSIEASGESFRVIARCSAATSPGCTNYAVDQTLEVQPTLSAGQKPLRVPGRSTPARSPLPRTLSSRTRSHSDRL